MPAAAIAFVIIIIAAACLIRSRYETGHIVFRYYDVYSEKIKGAFDGYTIALMADLHDKGRGKRNDEMLLQLSGISPDAVMAAGDMATAKRGRAKMSECLHIMKELAAAYPVYYAPGNHEHRMRVHPEKYGHSFNELYSQLAAAGVIFMEDISLTLIDGEDLMTITGLDLDEQYYKKGRHVPMNVKHLYNVIGSPDRSGFHILLAHSPDYFKEYAEWGADLVLCGHYHGGTVRLPLLGGVISPDLKLFPEYSRGMFKKGDCTMIVSGGMGTHSVNLRLGNISEVPVIRLHSAAEKEVL